MNIPPFYVGQRVVAVDAIDGSFIKNGNEYIIAEVRLWQGVYWHVTVTIRANHPLRPSIFAPIQDAFNAISFEQVVELESPLINTN